MDIVSSYQPPLFGNSGGTTHMDAKWLGACSDGLVPGDILLPSGKKMNIDMLSQAAAGGFAAYLNKKIPH
jgi:hypothetical protein